MKNNVLTALFAAIIGSLITLAAYYFILKDQVKTVRVESAASPAYNASYFSTAKEAAEAPFDFTFAAEKVTPSVVHITSTQQATARSEQYQQIPEFFREFFGDRFQGAPEQGPRVGVGSGVIISTDGYIVTNNHVVANADELDVVLTDNRRYRANVVGTDPTTDLALLKIDEEDLPYLSLANSDDLKVGQWVMAAGNPFGYLNSTVTSGIISALGRNINILQDQYAIESFIQTDAAVNPGNSGGALVNINGDLIGINTAIASPTGAYTGYAFAVPSNIVKKVVEDLKDYGTVQRGFLGVMIREVDATVAEENNLDFTRGVLVDSVIADGSAIAAGIEEGDVIIKVDERTVNTTSDLLSYIGRKRPGDQVDVTIIRDGKENSFNMTLKARDGSTELAARERSTAFEELGAEFQNLTKEEAQELNLSGGVKVTRTYPGKLRQQGVRPGFIITGIANKPVRSIEDLSEVVEGEKGGVLIEGVYPDAPGEVQYYGIGL